jgi:hypothetical protein
MQGTLKPRHHGALWTVTISVDGAKPVGSAVVSFGLKHKMVTMPGMAKTVMRPVPEAGDGWKNAYDAQDAALLLACQASGCACSDEHAPGLRVTRLWARISQPSQGVS